MGRQHQGMDGPGVRQVPEGSGDQGKMEKTGCKIICGAPTTLAVKGLMMMMMMMRAEPGQIGSVAKLKGSVARLKDKTRRAEPGHIGSGQAKRQNICS